MSGQKAHEYRVMLSDGAAGYAGGNTGWLESLENGLTAYNIALIAILQLTDARLTSFWQPTFWYDTNKEGGLNAQLGAHLEV